MKPIQRLEWYLKHKKIKFGTLERALELGTGYISKQVKRGGSIGSDILEKICNAYPALNPTWLLTGRGEPELETGAATGNAAAQFASENQQGISFDRLKMIDNLPITDKEKYELCKLFAEKMILQVNLLEQELGK